VALAAITFAGGACGPSGSTFEITGLGGGGFGNICAGSTPTVARIRIQPSQVNLRLGLQVWIEAMPLDTLGQVVYCAPIIEWSSANPSIATVSAGLVVGVTAGKTYIRASSGEKVDSAEVNVVATTIGSVTIELVPQSLLVGQTAGLVLVARDTCARRRAYTGTRSRCLRTATGFRRGAAAVAASRR
jgi:Bacterial Ig-like domain (group 2)